MSSLAGLFSVRLHSEVESFEADVSADMAHGAGGSLCEQFKSYCGS